VVWIRRVSRNARWCKEQEQKCSHRGSCYSRPCLTWPPLDIAIEHDTQQPAKPPRCRANERGQDQTGCGDRRRYLDAQAAISSGSSGLG
jgi:hypothetical protein